jgi:hypothetical protein
MSGSTFDPNDPSTWPVPPIPPDGGPIWTGNSGAGLGSNNPNAAAYQQGGGFADTLGQVGSGLSQLTGSLGGAAGAGKGAGGLSNQAGAVQMPAIGGGLSALRPGVGTPTTRFGQSPLDGLLQVLMARRNAYLQATNPQGAKPIGVGLPTNLLGI